MPMATQAGATPRDLGDEVTAYLLDGDAEPDYWSVFRNALDGTVAVTVDSVPIGGRKVQMQMLGNLAACRTRPTDATDPREPALAETLTTWHHHLAQL